jgi:hypothetical protein
MKQRNKAIWTMFLLAILTLLEGVSIVQSSFSTASDKALAFIENVLPFDSERYSVALKNYDVTKLPDLGLTQPIYGDQEVLAYKLESEDSEADVVCTLQDGALYMCNVYTVKGSLISDRKYSNVIDAAAGFLQKYQSNSKLDSTEMLTMLTDVDSIENKIITSENLKLTVTHQDLTGTWFGDSIEFRWVRVINGCEYLVVNLSFRDGAFSGILDHRQRYSIGNTSVNISEEQAIKIALEAVKNYSYPMSDDWIISGFNVNEDQITATLHPRTREGNVLYPVWSVLLPLDGVYPGSVRELLVGIWAGSGEVYLVHHQAYGGSYPISDSDSGYIISDDNSGVEDATTSPSPSTPSKTSTASVDIIIIAIVAAVATVVAIMASALFIKKRRK